jgi:uncharacterized FlaG/YvyC family protein
MQVENIISAVGQQTTRNDTGLDSHTEARRDKQEAISSAAVASEITEQIKNLTQSELEKAIDSLNKYAGYGNFNINFARDDKTDSLVIKIVDRDTGETIRQIPPDQILRLRLHLREVLGLVFDYMA